MAGRLGSLGMFLCLGVPRSLLGHFGRISNGNFTIQPASRKTRLRSKLAKDMFEYTHNAALEGFC